jgi:amidase
VVGIKPTVGLTSRAGVIPVAHSQDTVGPMCRTVADAATVLGALVGVDPRDPATEASAGHLHRDYRPFLDADGLRGARVGIARDGLFGFSEKADAVAEQAIAVLAAAGATVVDPADIPTIHQLSWDDEETVLTAEFKHDLEAYLAERGDPELRTLADLVAFNQRHAAEELAWFGQERFLQSQAAATLDDSAYRAALAANRRRAGPEGIDAVLGEHRLDALLAPTTSPPWKIDLVDGDHELGSSSQPTSLAGYPAISVPAGCSFGLPVGVTFMGTAWSEPTLIRLAYAFEQASRARRRPGFRAGVVGE